jgi:hypothetical protein
MTTQISDLDIAREGGSLFISGVLLESHLEKTEGWFGHQDDLIYCCIEAKMAPASILESK